MRRTIAVTGATSGLGQSLLHAAHDRGFELRVLSRRPLGMVEGWGTEVPFDLARADQLEATALDGCDALVHIAAHIPPNQENPSEASRCFEINAVGTLHLLQKAQAAKIRHVVLIGAANAYLADVGIASEDSPMYPIERAPYYLVSKIAQEIFSAQWGRAHDLPVTCLRVSSLYGAGKSTGAIADMARKLLAGQQVTLQNGGEFAADFVSNEDVRDAVLLFLDSPFSGPLNIGSGKRASIREVASHLVQIAGADFGNLTISSGGLKDAGFPAIDISKAVGLGYRPSTLVDGLTRLVDWLKTGQLAIPRSKA